MSRVLENFEPARALYYFEEICKIPHGSKNTKAISDYVVDFAKSQGLKFYQDDLNNVIIYKDAFPGYENAPVMMLQGHLDMVCEKLSDCSIDFTKDPLDIYVEDGYLTANGTTLGGDDGIAVAYMMAILEDKSIKAPALECVFTVDEEVGLEGAVGLDCSKLSAKYLLNLDNEEEGAFIVGCAGGMRSALKLPVEFEEVEGKEYKISVSGLLGGHSGQEIDKNRANAHILLGRILYTLDEDIPYAVISLTGGKMDNAIARECSVNICAAPENKDKIVKIITELNDLLLKEYSGSDDGIKLSVEEIGDFNGDAITETVKQKFIFILMNVPNGIMKMSAYIPGLVETSLNLGILNMDEEFITCSFSVRSSVGSAKRALANRLQLLIEFLGGEYKETGEYPEWVYRPESAFRDKAVKIYEDVTGTKARVFAIHAGLECGVFSRKMPELDMISIGPDMKDIHTPQEKLRIESVENVWKYVIKLLEEMK